MLINALYVACPLTLTLSAKQKTASMYLYPLLHLYSETLILGKNSAAISIRHRIVGVYWYMMPLSKFNPRLLLLVATVLGCFEHFFLGSYSFVETSDTLSLYIPRYSLYAHYVSNFGSVNWLSLIHI